MRKALLASVLGLAVVFFTCSCDGSLPGRAVYTSTGIIRVAPTLPRIQFHTEQNVPMPDYDAYVGTLVTMMRAQRITDLALAHEAWTKLGRPNDDKARQAFMKSLHIERPAGTELILVSFTDADPYAAQSGVKAVIDCFSSVYIESETKQAAQLIDVIESRRSTLREQQSRLREEYMALSAEHPGASDQMVALKTKRLEEMEAALIEAQLDRGDKADAALDGKIDRLKKLHDATAKDLAGSVAHRLLFERNAAEMKRVDKSLAEISLRRDELVTEPTMASRVKVLSTGDQPLAPDSKSR